MEVVFRRIMIMILKIIKLYETEIKKLDFYKKHR